MLQVGRDGGEHRRQRVVDCGVDLLETGIHARSGGTFAVPLCRLSKVQPHSWKLDRGPSK